MSITDNQQVLFSKSNYPLPHNWLPFSTCILFHKIVMYYHLLDYFSGFSCLFYLWLRFSTFTLLHIWIFEGRMPCKKTAETIFRGFCWMPLWTVQMEYTALLYIFRTQFGNTVSWMPSNYLVWNTVIWPRSSAISVDACQQSSAWNVYGSGVGYAGSHSANLTLGGQRRHSSIVLTCGCRGTAALMWLLSRNAAI